jgi:hypothetical protein
MGVLRNRGGRGIVPKFDTLVLWQVSAQGCYGNESKVLPVDDGGDFGDCGGNAAGQFFRPCG